MTEIKFTIDGKECKGRPGQTIVEAANENGVYIPVLCNFEGLKPAGSCRVCTVRVGGRYMAACTQPVTEGMAVENKVPDLQDMRVGDHRDALRRGQPHVPDLREERELRAAGPGLPVRHDGPPLPLPVAEPGDRRLRPEDHHGPQPLHPVPALRPGHPDQGRQEDLRRPGPLRACQDRAWTAELAAKLNDETAQKAMDICPVGAILKKEVGFVVPIGKRKFDKKPIGSDIEETARS